MILPAPPDAITHMILMLTPTLTGAISTFYLLMKTESPLSILPFLTGFAIFIIVIIYITPEIQFYNEQMTEIIQTTDCSNLPDIVHQRQSYKEEVVDEIVLRCLIDEDNQNLIAFVRSHQT